MLVEAPDRLCHFIADLNLVSPKEKEGETIFKIGEKRASKWGGSRLHGVEVVWCHQSGKGHRGNSATGTVVCFVYGGIVSHYMNAGLVHVCAISFIIVRSYGAFSLYL